MVILKLIAPKVFGPFINCINNIDTTISYLNILITNKTCFSSNIISVIGISVFNQVFLNHCNGNKDKSRLCDVAVGGIHNIGIF